MRKKTKLISLAIIIISILIIKAIVLNYIIKDLNFIHIQQKLYRVIRG